MKLIKTGTYMMASALVLSAFTGAFAEPTHGISMTGGLDLPADFDHFPYVNVDAQPGGRIVYSEYGSFDSFSPFIVAGKTPFGFKAHIYESFMKRSVDESFSLYGLLAEKVDMNEDRTSIEFFLNPAAKFADGSPVTIADAMWSYDILAEKGLSKYARYMDGVTGMEQTGDYSMKFTMTGENRELPLLLAMMPIMKQSEFEGVEFDAGMTEPTTGSGAYTVADYKMGEYITFHRDPNYWGKDLPVNKGLNNLDEIKYVYYADPDAMFEGFKAGDVNVWVEGDPKRWESYDFEAFNNGDVVKHVIQHSRPTGLQGFFINTRRAPFDDWRVREALITGFNFPFANKTINDSAYPRITSLFANSYLAKDDGPAEGKVADLLADYADDLLPGAFEGYTLPAGDESGRDRAGIKHAMEMLTEAGFSVKDGVMQDEEGNALEISVMVKSPEEEKLANIWADGLKPLGVGLTIDTVDANTHATRLENFDYDVVYSYNPASLSPGAEQYKRFSAEAAETPKSNNYMGTKQPALEGMIDAMLSATTLEDYVAAVKALDRVIMSERFIVPVWYTPDWRMLAAKELHFPEYTPKFGYWPGYAPEAMYWAE